MATITNGSNTITIDNRIFQKDDVTIRAQGNNIEFRDGKEILNIPYSEISSPTSNSILDLFDILNGYLNEGSVMTTSISATKGSGGSIETAINLNADVNESYLSAIVSELQRINTQLEKIRL